MKTRLFLISEAGCVLFTSLGIIALMVYGSAPGGVTALLGYALMTVAGLFAIPSILRLGTENMFGRSLALISIFVVYFVWRAIESPVAYFARQDLLLIGVGWISLVTWASILKGGRYGNFLLVAVGILGLSNSFLAGVQSAGGIGVLEVPMVHLAEYRERSGGFFGNPNHGAAWCSLGALSFWCLGSLGKGGAASRLVYIFAGLGCAFGVLFAKSRGGAIGLGVGASMLIILALLSYVRVGKIERWKIVVGTLGAATLLTVGGILASEVLGTRFSRQLVEVSKTDVRVQIWKSALMQFQENPVTGTGSRTFADYCWKYRTPEMRSWTREAEFTHNEHLQLLADYGIVGVAAGWGILGVFVWCCSMNVLRNQISVPRSTLAFGAVTIAAMAAQGLVEFQWHVPAIFVVISLASSGALIRGGAREKPTRQKMMAFCGLAGAVGAIVILGAQLPRFIGGGWAYLLGMEEVRNSGRSSLVATGHFNRAINVDSGLLPAYDELGKCRLKLANGVLSDPFSVRRATLRKALDVFKDSLEIRPHSVPILVETGRLLDELGEPDAAEGYFATAVEWAPLYGIVRNAQGMHYFKRGDWDLAREAFDEAMKTTVAHDRTFTWQMLRTLDSLEKKR